MKRTKSITSFLLAVILSLATFIGFTSSMTVKNVHADGGGQNNVVVGISLPTLQSDYITNISNSLQASFRNRGFTTKVYDANNNAEDQANQIKAFIDDGVNVIVVMPVNDEALAEVLTEANERGIKVIVIGENKGLYPSATYVNFGSTSKAEKDANAFLNNRYKPDGNNTVIVFACNSEHGNNYYQTIDDILSVYQNIEIIVFRIDNISEVESYLNEWLDNHNNNLPDAIFNCCNANAKKVKEILINRGFIFAPGGMPLYGFDSSYSYDYETFADFIADLIQDIMSGEIVPTDDETYYVDF
ncbi:MAG: substrate-binding domain-containing protein [Clostridia bacterium]|nr:substrate-binding domain-containing protein [Clostridia bacterium]